MGKHRTRQSNGREYCPLCALSLTARFAAVSHYEGHVRRGELEARGSGEYREYRISPAGRKTIFEWGWWHGGVRHIHDLYVDPTEKDRAIEHARVQFHVALAKRQRPDAGSFAQEVQA